MPSVADKRREFRRLHKSGCFVIPNPWDLGSAAYLEHLGFKALASTSSGFAFALGRPDYGITLDMALTHLRQMVEGTNVPLNADFEGGFAHDPAGVAKNVKLCVATGVAGLSIEDSTGDPAKPLYDLEQAVERVRAARKAIDESGQDVVFTARAECYFVGRPDRDEAIRRIKAYADAGADCLYAPGLKTREDMAAVIASVAPKPVNIIVSSPIDMSVSDIAALGARRISVGGALARVAFGAFIRTARDIAENGSFKGFADAAPGAELNALFAARHKAEKH